MSPKFVQLGEKKDKNILDSGLANKIYIYIYIHIYYTIIVIIIYNICSFFIFLGCITHYSSLFTF
jgi:hypothetical protein